MLKPIRVLSINLEYLTPMFSMEWPNHIQSCRPGVSSENRSHGFYDGRQHILRPFFTMEKNDGVYILRIRKKQSVMAIMLGSTENIQQHLRTGN
jgi:hypothetical protein